MRRSILIALVLVLWRAGPVAAAPCWEPPVVAPVVDPFRAPACPWCPGNRGIAYGTPPGVAVRALAAGQVTFAGDVAGTVYVVVEVASGWRLTYGNLTDIRVGAGDPVVAGLLLGATAGEFHFGLRFADDTYRDPAPYLGTWRYRPRLVPVDGPAPPAPPPTLACANRPGSDPALGARVQAL